MSDSFLTLVGSFSSLFNGLGRVTWGVICDQTTYRFSMITLCIALASLLITFSLCQSASMYFAWVCGIFFCVGGIFTLSASAAAIYFGSQNVGANFGLLYYACAISMLVGSMLAP